MKEKQQKKLNDFVIAFMSQRHEKARVTISYP